MSEKNRDHFDPELHELDQRYHQEDPAEQPPVPTPKKEQGFKRFLKSFFPWKGDSVGEIVRKTVMVVALVALIGSACYIGARFVQSYLSNKHMKDLYSQMEKDANMDADDFWKKLKEQYPNVDFPEGLQQKYATLYALNQDTAGWLKVEGNSYFDFPIVKAADNDFYLHRDFYKQTTAYGNPFMDYRDTIKPLSKNTVIYGHHMRDNKLFAQLMTMYEDMDSYKKNPVIEFNTIFEDHQWKVIGAFYSNAETQDDNGYAFPYTTTEMTNESFMGLIREIQKRSLYTTGVDVNENDQILTLSTCAYNFHESRFVVVARMVRDGESTQVDTSQAKSNSNPKYPQAWYDKNNRKNPYKDDEKWIPRVYKNN